MTDNQDKPSSHIENAKKFLSDNKESILSGVSSAIDYVSESKADESKSQKAPTNEKDSQRQAHPAAIFLCLILSIGGIALFVHSVHHMGGTIFTPLHSPSSTEPPQTPGDLAAHTAGLIGFSIITDILGRI